MHPLTPEQLRRWDAWHHANALSGRRTERMCRVVGPGAHALSPATIAVTIWSR